MKQTREWERERHRERNKCKKKKSKKEKRDGSAIQKARIFETSNNDVVYVYDAIAVVLAVAAAAVHHMHIAYKIIDEAHFCVRFMDVLCMLKHDCRQTQRAMALLSINFFISSAIAHQKERIKKLQFLHGIIAVLLEPNCIVNQNGSFVCSPVYVNGEASLLARFVFTWTGEVNKRTKTHVRTYTRILAFDFWMHADSTIKRKRENYSHCQEYITFINVLFVCVWISVPCTYVCLAADHVRKTLKKSFLFIAIKETTNYIWPIFSVQQHWSTKLHGEQKNDQRK